MASGDTWSDFQQTRHSIRLNTVDRLKHIIQGINEECHQQLAKSGKKQDIIQRIEGFLDSLYTIAATDQYAKIKDIIQQVRNKGQIHLTCLRSYHSKRFANSLLPPPPPNICNSLGKTSTYDTLNPGPSTMYNTYSISRRPPATTTSSSSVSYGAKQNITFKDSPFYTIKEAVSRVTECPESTGTSDRRQAGFDFHLSSDQITRLAASGSKTQLRLFCTSSVFYAGNNPYAANNVPCLIEFPPTCEVRINTVQLTANLKGLKKKPGTAPPPDIGKLVKYSSSNRVDMVYLNTQNQQGVPPKKYYLIAMLVEVTSVSELVDDVKTRYKSSEEILQQTEAVQAIADDDDIVAGPQKLSLKCPLSFVRIITPTRSSKCVHTQCFDATSWFSVMEQTTTWLCPVCEKVLDCAELIVDGYVDAILKQTPSSVEDVIVEPDGEWHTADNKYASQAWKASHPPTTNQPAPPHKRVKMEESYDQLLSKSSSEDKKAKSDNVDVVVLDSDSDEEEDEGHVKRELSPSQSSQMNCSYASIPRTETEISLSQQSDVIDLTADSDEERPAPQTGKRTASEAGLSPSSPTEPIWKKGRYDHDHPVLPPLNHIAGGSTPTSLPPRPPTNLPAPLLSYPVTPYSYPGYQNRPGLSGSVPPLPPLSTSHLPSRPSNSNTRWS